MKRVIGIGGVFFKAENPKELAAWYEKHLGVEFGGNSYAEFKFQEKEKGSISFSLFGADTKYFAPSEKQFMINFRVDDLDALLKVLREEGVHVFDETDESYGKFGWILDPEGNKVELWQPAE
jgi:predicted enzyme related to lactoylglutathione lyase